jgi:hypothetical protein
MKVKPKNSSLSNFNWNLNYSVIPDALIAYHSKILYNTYFMLETQLSGLGADKQTCEKLESITQRVFNAWLALDYKGEE